METKKAKQEEKEAKTKSLKAYEGVHKKLKIHVAKTGENMVEFVSNAILEKLSK